MGKDSFPEIYAIVDEFVVKNKRVIVLDKKLSLEDFRSSMVEVDGEKYSYGLTHNDFWITIQCEKTLLGKELFFVR